MANGLDLRIVGVDKLERLGRDLKAAGDKDLRKELLKAGRETGKPIKAEIASSALAMLPRRGGLAALIAGAKIRVSTRLTGRNVGVSIIGKWSGHDLKAVDEGKIRHPIRQRKVEKERGRKPLWVSQQITPGYWTKVFDGTAPDIAREEFLKAVDRVAAKLRAGS